MNLGAKVNDQASLINFLTNCQNLCVLSLSFSELDQNFYNKLPSFSSLTCLSVDTDLKLNFEFLNRMYNLI